MNTSRKIVAFCTVLAFGSNSLAQTLPGETPPAGPDGQQAEGKFVWGILIKLAAPYVLDYFSHWVKRRIATAHEDRPSMGKLEGNSHFASIVSLYNYMTGKGGGEFSAAAPPNVGSGAPVTELQTGNNGENYQGVNITLIGVDANAQVSEFRTVADGFTTGERFKLRILSTYEALVVLGNITPKGVQRQIYPPDHQQAVLIPAGKEILLPLNSGDYLQFTGDSGRDQLTFTVRDPRTLQTGHVSRAQVFRRDEVYGSNFVQEVMPGQYPMISEAIGIEHK